MTATEPPAAVDQPDRVRERLAEGPLLATVDFDGTVAEIVPRPADATIRPDARRALARLAGAPDTEVAVVSGRALADLRERVGIEPVAYAGNHGLELAVDDRRRVHPEARGARDALERALAAVEAAIGDVAGVELEDKGLTATVHSRRVGDPTAAERVRSAVRTAADAEPALRTTEAKRAVELRPAVEWDKGRAVAWLREAVGLPEPLVLYVGDDETDEDAHRAIGDAGVTVRVGEGETVAAHRLPDPEAVADLLTWIARLRAAE